MDKNIIKRIITERHREVRERRLVMRPHQFEERMNYVLVGIRRAGKSCLMIQDMQLRINSGQITIEDCLYINFEDERIRYIHSTELYLLLDCYAEMFGERKPMVYLDEIQVIEGWETFVRRLADQQYRVMVTGSNAKMLSSEIATTLGGRFVVKEIWPFSYSEYLSYRGIGLNKNWQYDSTKLHELARQIEDYFCYGGFAETFDLVEKREWINSLYHKILMGDIVSRNGIRGSRMISLLTRKIADTVTIPVALSRLQHIIKSTGERISLPTVKDYLQFLEDGYLIFSLSNFVSPLTERETIKKRYFTDNGLLNNFLFNSDEKLLENLCAIHLLKRYSNTEEPRLFYYHRNIEVDFYAPEDALAIQVSLDIHNDDTSKREVGALVALNKVYKLERAIIVTRDQEERIIEQELIIDVIPVWKWLLME